MRLIDYYYLLRNTELSVLGEMNLRGEVASIYTYYCFLPLLLSSLDFINLAVFLSSLLLTNQYHYYYHHYPYYSTNIS